MPPISRLCLLLSAVPLGVSCVADVGVRITSPAEGAAVSGAVEVALELTGDVDALSRVDLLVSGSPRGRLERPALFDQGALVIAWDTADAARGPTEIAVTAYDLFGAEVARHAVTVRVSAPLAPGGGSDGEGEHEGEGEGEAAGEGEGEGEGDGEGEGEGDVFPPDWTPPPARPFARFSDFPSNAQGDAGAPNPGNLTMYLHVPEDMPPNAPVIVALHGCSQDASQYRTTTGWTALADLHKLYVIFPEQTITAEHNPQKIGNPMRCFNWAGYYGERMDRGQGENQSIVEMVATLTDSDVYQADPSRVFVTGLSAGAAMAVLLLAEWPDVFAAGAPMAGVPFDCARSVSGAMDCMRGSAATLATPSTWGARVRAAAPAGWSGPWPRVMVWQGEADGTVSPANLTEIMEQWTDVHAIDQTADDTTPLKPGAAHTRRAHVKGGVTVVETVTVPAMGHGVPVDPGVGEDQGGAVGGFAFDVGIWSSFYAARFFGVLDDAPAPPDDPPDDPTDPPPPTGCEQVTATITLHAWALPPRVRNVGTLMAPSWQVVGSGEPIPSTVNPYLDDVTLHTTVDGWALGACP